MVEALLVYSEITFFTFESEIPVQVNVIRIVEISSISILWRPSLLRLNTIITSIVIMFMISRCFIYVALYTFCVYNVCVPQKRLGSPIWLNCPEGNIYWICSRLENANTQRAHSSFSSTVSSPCRPWVNRWKLPDSEIYRSKSAALRDWLPGYRKYQSVTESVVISVLPRLWLLITLFISIEIGRRLEQKRSSLAPL